MVNAAAEYYLSLGILSKSHLSFEKAERRKKPQDRIS